MWVKGLGFWFTVKGLGIRVEDAGFGGKVWGVKIPGVEFRL